LGVRVYHRTHQLAAGRAARDRDAPRLGKAALDQSLRHVDEVGEGVDPAFELAGLVPRTPEVVAAADMRDGIGEAAVDEAEAGCRKARRNGDAVGSVAVEMQRTRASPVLAIHNRDRDRRAVARGDLDPLSGVEVAVVA